MVVDWTTTSFAPVFSGAPLYVAEDQTASLTFRRITDDWIMEVIADVDGPVHMAVLRVFTGGETPSGQNIGCTLFDPGYRAPRFLIGVRGDDKDGDMWASVHQGSIGGVVGQAPMVFKHFTDDYKYSWAMNEGWVAWADATTFRLYASPWDPDAQIYVTSPPDDPDHLHLGQPQWWGDALFWTTGGGARAGINVWTPGEGARPFIRWVGDATQGAADLGTDGVDLVWAYGQGGLVPGTSYYATRSVMTAPFTTDGPAGMATARRLRSLPGHCIGCRPFVVGCGYAAHSGGANDVIVVRLSDGWSWTVPSEYPDALLEVPLGVTCDEVFAQGTLHGVMTIARIRLDSLDPGVPPD